MRIVSVVGARPNFMKLAPVQRALAVRPGVKHFTVHTGQHYDRDMSQSFFTDLEIPNPDRNLEVGPASHAQQTAAVMMRLEPVLLELAPDVVIVYGDVNSTLAAALVATKLGITLAHVEAGLRSGDRSMPEEINRIVTDRVADVLFTPSRDADENLRAEGVPAGAIDCVGNVMIDTLVAVLPRARALGPRVRGSLHPGGYIVVTLHRPSNVDHPETLAQLFRALDRASRQYPVLFPVHPRTRARLKSAGIHSDAKGDFRLLDPLSYIEMLSLVADARLVVTDSGGLQEETTFLGVPCLTVRPNTERPITITQGTNRLVESTEHALSRALAEASEIPRRPCTIELWDGCASLRIAERLCGGAEKGRKGLA